MSYYNGLSRPFLNLANYITSIAHVTDKGQIAYFGVL